MTWLVTGINGFVGSYVSEHYKCVGLIDSKGAVDVTDTGRIREAMARVRPNCVIHLAAQTFVPASFDAPKETFDINFYGTYNLLDALKDIGFRGKLLYVSSSDIYGTMPPEELPIAECQPLRPRNPYAVSKVAAEALCYQWSQTEDFEVVVVRPFNHIGPRQDDRFVLSNFARQIAEIKRGLRPAILHVGDIDVTRDFTDVRDVVRAYALLMQLGRNGETYNVCSGEEKSIRFSIDLLQSIAGISVEIRVDRSRFRPGEQRRICGSPTKLFMTTGWKPEISFEKSLKDIYQYWERVI